MNERSPDENHEWKSIRSELCGMLEEQLDGESGSVSHATQCGRSYVRLRAAAALRGAAGGLLRLKHREKTRRALVGPFDRCDAMEPDEALSAYPCCTAREAAPARATTRAGCGANGGTAPPDRGDAPSNGSRPLALDRLRY